MKLSNEPQKTRSKIAWYYEERYGIEVIVGCRDKDGGYIKTEHVKIPWRNLRASLKRRDAEQGGDGE
jgi:hypothetical protein